VAPVPGVFFDTSVLLAGLLDLGGPSAAAQRIMDAVASGKLGRPRTAWHCCLEFFAVSTRLPEEMRLTPAQAGQLLAAEVRQRMEVVALPEGRWDDFWTRVQNERVAGGRIYDAHIAEVARHHKARTVVTDNVRHFSSLMAHGIQVLSSEQFAARLPR
jgi:predicted nucleic acid-binding protein